MAIWNKRLRKSRVAMGLSLQGAVNLLYETYRIKIHRANLGKVERGESDMPVTKFRALCNIYSSDPRWILDWKGD